MIGWGDWYWYIVWGIIGGLALEYIKFLRGIRPKGMVTKWAIPVSSILLGGFFSLAIEPPNKFGALLIGAGWQTILMQSIDLTLLEKLSDYGVEIPKDTHIHGNVKLDELLETMLKLGFDRLPIIREDNKPIGIVTDGMIDRETDKKKIAEKVMERMIYTISEDKSLHDAFLKMEHERVEGITVVGKDGKVKRIISKDDIEPIRRRLIG